MAIQAKYDSTRGLNETLDSAGSAEFHVSGVGVSYDLQVNRHHVIKLTTVADSATLFQSSISITDTTTTYKLFFNRAGVAAVDIPAGHTNVELSADGGDTAGEVATALEAVIEALGGGGAAFDSAVVNGNEITVQFRTMGPPATPHDMGTSGITAEIVSAGSGSTVLKTTGVTVLASTHDDPEALTLGNLTAAEAGTLKTIHQTDAGTQNKDVTVAKHTGGDDQVLRFNAENEFACLVWLGDKWATVGASNGVVQ